VATAGPLPASLSGPDRDPSGSLGLMRRAELPEHTCGWSPHYRRTVPNHECARCIAEDEEILDTQRWEQKRRARTYRPARAQAAVGSLADSEDAAPVSEPPVELRRETFVPLAPTELPER